MNTNKVTGFTLLEMMVVIAIIAILASVAMPMMSQTLANSKSNAAFRDVIATLKAAKAGARDDKSFSYAVVCASSNGTSCDSSNWTDGWLAFGDIDGSGDLNGAEPILAVQGSAGKSSNISVVNNTSNQTVSKFVINQDGFTSNNLYACGNAGPPAYVFRICQAGSGSNPVTGKAVIYTPSGAIRLGRDTDKNGLHNVGAADIVCPSTI